MKALEIFQFLLESNKLGSLCVCAGSRNAALIEKAARWNSIPMFSFYDERAAAFFALGRAKLFPDKWAGVLTTSGTAVAELLPAVIEAHYEQLPLLCLTADRPPNFRGTGAPQSIDQKDLLGIYGGTCFDFQNENDPALIQKFKNQIERPHSPLHLNFCLEDRGQAK